jgi:adenine-specific DNA-methyltransferase
MASSKDKFLHLLYSDLLKVDLADLDFGFYRILKYRRDEVRAFFDKRLPEIMAEAMQGQAADRQAEVDNALATVRGELDKAAGLWGIAAPFTPGGALDPRIADMPAGKRWRQLTAERAHLEAASGFSQTEEDRLYNHLYLFFSRYYADGDFIRQPRRGREGRYSVAYNGEDVHFHWRGRGSHYVKTTEELTSYRYRDGDWTVEFQLAEASQEQDNVKGKTRYFFPQPAGFDVDAAERTACLPFVFRPLTKQEEDRYKGNGGVQERIIDGLLEPLQARLQPGLDGATLAHHIRRYTRKHRTDYFVHPNLGAFLRAELDWYLKNEFLDLDAIAGSTDPAVLSDRLIKLKALRSIGGLIIDFLDQIETFQAALFEKRKLVLRADYLAPVRLLDRALWPEILKNPAQIAAWRDLFGLAGAVTEKTLAQYPTLVVDTRHFDEPFKLRLLACYEDIDEALDGLLVHAENYAALRTLEYRYLGRVKCIYIDPPYNTGSDEFLYKDDFSRHSTWLTMMEERLRLGRRMMAEDGSIFVSLDDNEQARAKLALDAVFGEGNFVATVIWQKVFSPKNTATYFSDDHDYLLAYAESKEAWKPSLFPRTSVANARYSNPDGDIRGVWTSGDLSARNPYSEGIYPVETPAGRLIPGPPPGRYWTINCHEFWRLDVDNRIWWGEDGNNIPRRKNFLSEVRAGVVPQTLWKHEQGGNTQGAKKELISVVRFARSEDILNTVKPTKLLRRVLLVGTEPTKEQLTLDFFAGSGPTAHAVIAQNRDDGGSRRFALVEMGDYFNSMLMERVLRVLYAPEWKDHRPKDGTDFTAAWVDRSPRLVKVLRLESFEDSLNALELPEERNARLAGQQDIFGDDYLLKYMFAAETEDAPARLNTPALERPFDYKLRVHGNDGLREVPVDLVETFNLLMGFHVQRIRALADGKRPYRIVEALEDGRPVLVVWRDMTDFDHARDRAFVEAQYPKLAEYATVYVNGDSSIPNGRGLDGEFHRRMNERDEHFLQ